MTSSEIILEIIAYVKKQGVDFETALRMFQMMYDDKAYLDDWLWNIKLRIIRVTVDSLYRKKLPFT